MNLVTKIKFHNKVINSFCALPANDLVKYTIENKHGNTTVLGLERGSPSSTFER